MDWHNPVRHSLFFLMYSTIEFINFCTETEKLSSEALYSLDLHVRNKDLATLVNELLQLV